MEKTAKTAPSSDEETGIPMNKTISSVESPSTLVRLDPFGIPLHPTPTTDDLDPLNWTKWQKYKVLFIICYLSFLALYGSTTTVESFFLLQELFDVSYSQVNWTLAIPGLGAALGALLFSGLGDIFGRRPVLIACSIIALIAAGCTTIQGISYGGYMFCRFLQGLGGAPGMPIGFAVVRDISWEHERGFNIGLWVMGIDVGFVLGGVIGGFTAATGPYWAMYHVAIAYGILVCLLVFALPETLYPRELVLELEETGQNLQSLRRTKEIKPWNLMKIPGVNHPKAWECTARFFMLWKHPRLLLALLPFLFLQYWWSLSFLTMAPAAYANYSTQIQGLLFLGIVIGFIFAEIFFSGRLSDIICARLALRNDGVRTPEMRLWLGYLGAVLGAIGPIIWGLSVDRNWHWMVGQVGFFLFAAGMQTGNTAVTTYIFECYPNNAVDILTFYAVMNNLSAFIEPFFINYWVEAIGYTWCFASQGLLTLLIIPTFACLQKWGPKLQKDIKF